MGEEAGGIGKRDACIGAHHAAARGQQVFCRLDGGLGRGNLLAVERNLALAGGVGFADCVELLIQLAIERRQRGVLPQRVGLALLASRTERLPRLDKQ